MDLKDQLEFIVRGSEVKRFHAVRTIAEETVGHHSFMVAMLCRLIDPGCSTHLLLSALTHDLPEFIFGDIPANTKRILGSYQELENLEITALTNVGLNYSLTAEEEHVLKLADVLAGLIFCVREIQLGNASPAMAEIKERYISYIGKMPLSHNERNVVDTIMRRV